MPLDLVATGERADGRIDRTSDLLPDSLARPTPGEGARATTSTCNRPLSLDDLSNVEHQLVPGPRVVDRMSPCDDESRRPVVLHPVRSLALGNHLVGDVGTRAGLGDVGSPGPDIDCLVQRLLETALLGDAVEEPGGAPDMVAVPAESLEDGWAKAIPVTRDGRTSRSQVRRTRCRGRTRRDCADDGLRHRPDRRRGRHARRHRIPSHEQSPRSRRPGPEPLTSVRWLEPAPRSA